MKNRKTSDMNLSRRNVLKSVGVAGGISLAPVVAGASSEDGLANVTERGDFQRTTGGDEQTVSVQATGEATYSFSVTGGLETVGAPEEQTDNGTASGSIVDDTHEFEFTGEFTEFETEGDIEVYVNGDPFDAEAFPHNSVTIVAPGGTEVDISASGRLEPVDSEDGLTQINSRRLSGKISGETTFEYAGEITYFEPKEEVRVAEKNGDRIASDEIVPSRLPNELEISGEDEEVTVRTSAVTETVDNGSDNGDDTSITARPGSDAIVARYDGNIKKIEHETGATIEFTPSNMRITCSAPEDESVDFGAEAVNGVVHDRTMDSEMTISVEAGASKQIKHYGDITQVSIEGVELSIDPDAYEEAIASAKLQHAAEFERTDEYETIAEDADGRIRHDATSLYYRSATTEGATTLVMFQIANSESGDYGRASLGRSDETGDIIAAGYETIWEADDGYPEKMEVNLLAGTTETVETADTFERQTFERGAQLSGAQASAAGEDSDNLFEGHDEIDYNEDVSAELISLPSLPSPGDIIDYFGSALDSFASEVGVAKETIADITSAAIEQVDISDAAEDLEIDAGVMIVDSQELLIEIIAEAEDQLPRSRFWDVVRGINPGFAGSVFDLADAGVFDELADNNFGCAGCLAIVALASAVAFAASATIICGAMVSTAVFAAGCAFFFAELLDFLDDAAGLSQFAAESFCGDVAGVC